jgi:hypothetical protein
MRLISWNMNCRSSNWSVLAALMNEHDADAAMVQEAVAPDGAQIGSLRVFGDPSLKGKPWRIPIPRGAKRSFASAVAVRSEAAIKKWIPVPIAGAPYGAPAISHPGQWVAITARFSLKSP